AVCRLDKVQRASLSETTSGNGAFDTRVCEKSLYSRNHSHRSSESGVYIPRFEQQLVVCFSPPTCALRGSRNVYFCYVHACSIATGSRCHSSLLKGSGELIPTVQQDAGPAITFGSDTGDCKVNP
ncbi:unnamed protein product, partial [Ectocarpus sp. 12 AP-2014]